MVILGKEPMIVDTGTPANREQWLEDVFSLVEPTDVRWIFLSHDDVDHTGNLDEAMTACPNAKLVCNWAMVERHTNCFDFPLDRCRWVMDGESLDIGDRTLHALRPPVYDSPTTRGLFDPTTGVYWAVDTFATPLPDPKMAIADLDPDFWDRGPGAVRARRGEPVAVDGRRPTSTAATSTDVQTSTSRPSRRCHSPVIEGPFIERAFAGSVSSRRIDPPDAARPVGPRPDRRRDVPTARLTSPGEEATTTSRCPGKCGRTVLRGS